MAETSLKQKLIAAGVAAAVPLVMWGEGIRQKVYIDPVGIPTACFGHTGPELRAGQTFTVEQCQNLLYTDLLRANDAVNSCISVPLTTDERAAYASFTYNVGGKALCGSTLVRKLNAGDHHGACAELSRWTYAKGIELPGLVKRRAAERAVCEGRPVTLS